MKHTRVVEDNPMNMELAVDLLEVYGYDITGAEDGFSPHDPPVHPMSMKMRLRFLAGS